MLKTWEITLILCLSAVAARPAHAADEGVCTDAARVAAERTSVPFAVLLAISQVETGRGSGTDIQPWPWTINDSGTGSWFASQQEAEAQARAIIAAGRTSFDLGCFQLNYRWHGGQFASVEAMLDPEANATYAAHFLADLYRESGDWSVAAGAYHSRTEEYAMRYRDRFDTAYAALSDDPQQARVVAQRERVNDFPLLQPRDGQRAPGSLVPLDL